MYKKPLIIILLTIFLTLSLLSEEYNLDSEFIAAENQFEAKELNKAEDSFNKVIKYCLKNKSEETEEYLLKSYNYMSLINLQKDNFKKSKWYSDKSLAIDQENPWTYNIIGFNFLVQNRYKEALSEFKKAISINPYYKFPVFNTGLCNYYLGEYDKGIQKFIEVLNLDPKHYPSYRYLFLSYLKQEEYNRALRIINLTINQFEEYKQNSYLERAEVFKKLKIYNKADKDILKAIEIDPENYKNYIQLALLNKKRNKIEEAINNYKEAIKLNEKAIQAYGSLSYLYIITENYNEAENIINKLFKITSTYSSAYFNRSFINYKNKNYKLSLKDIKKTIKYNNTHPYNYFSYIVIASKTSKSELNKAFKLLKKKMESFKNDYQSYKISEYLTDNISERDFLFSANRDKQKLCEDYFYIGIKYLTENNRDKAKEFFEKSINTGISYYYEYNLAKSELENIN